MTSKKRLLFIAFAFLFGLLLANTVLAQQPDDIQRLELQILEMQQELARLKASAHQSPTELSIPSNGPLEWQANESLVRPGQPIVNDPFTQMLDQELESQASELIREEVLSAPAINSLPATTLPSNGSTSVWGTPTYPVNPSVSGAIAQEVPAINGQFQGAPAQIAPQLNSSTLAPHRWEAPPLQVREYTIPGCQIQQIETYRIPVNPYGQWDYWDEDRAHKNRRR